MLSPVECLSLNYRYHRTSHRIQVWIMLCDAHRGTAQAAPAPSTARVGAPRAPLLCVLPLPLAVRVRLLQLACARAASNSSSISRQGTARPVSMERCAARPMSSLFTCPPQEKSAEGGKSDARTMSYTIFLLFEISLLFQDLLVKSMSWLSICLLSEFSLTKSFGLYLWFNNSSIM